MSTSWRRAGVTNDQARHQLSGSESPVTEWEEPVIYIRKPSMEGTGLRTSIPLIMNASISVSEFFLLSCTGAPGLWHTQSSVCNLHQHAVLACLLRPPINASMLHLFLSFCFCCYCKITSVYFKRKRKSTIKVQTPYRHLFLRYERITERGRTRHR